MSATKTSLIYNKIKEDLAKNTFPSGEKLKISALKEFYQVGLTPLREALSQLAAQGLLEQHLHKGFSTPKLSYEDILDLCQTRILIETEALRLSIERADMEWEASLVAAYHKLNRLRLSLKDIDAWNVAHDEFHSILISGSNSSHLINFSKQINLALDKYRRIAEPVQDYRDVLDRQHGELLELALQRNSEEAIAALTSHITLSSESAIELMRKM